MSSYGNPYGQTRMPPPGGQPARVGVSGPAEQPKPPGVGIAPQPGAGPAATAPKFAPGQPPHPGTDPFTPPKPAAYQTMEYRPGQESPGVGLRTTEFRPGRDTAPAGTNPIQPLAASSAPVANVPTVAPQVQPPRSAQVAGGPAPHADALNSWFDQQGYGPHSTEAQVNAARGQRNAAAAYGNLAQPGVAQPAQPGTAVYRGVGNAARVGLAPASTTAAAPTPRDHAREAIVEQLKYNREMARAARGGFTVNGMDEAAWGNAVMHHAAALQAHDASVASVRASDAVGSLSSLMQMDPAARALYLASKGVDANTIASLPQPQTPGAPSRFNATNYATAGAQDPNTAGAAKILDSGAPIHEKAAAFAAVPGVENPNNPHRQLWDAYMARQQTRPEFHHELGQYNPLDPSGSKVYDTSSPGKSLGSMFGAAKDGIFGVDPAIPARNRKFQADMARLGYGPAQVSVDANDVRARIGVRPADY